MPESMGASVHTGALFFCCLHRGSTAIVPRMYLACTSLRYDRGFQRGSIGEIRGWGNENDAASRSVVSEFVRLAILMKNLLVSSWETLM